MRRITNSDVLVAFKTAALLAVIPGCDAGTLLERTGISVKPPNSWKVMRPESWLVPGTPLASWSGPDGSSLVIYQTLWVPNGSAEMLLEAQKNRLANLPDAKLLTTRIERVGGSQAARIELIAPGTGDAMAPSGLGKPIQVSAKTLVPTHVIMLAVARPTETIFIVWHVPEQAHNRLEPDIRATLDSLRFRSNSAPSYKK